MSLRSEFGSNVSGNTRTANLPVFKGKVKTQKYLHSLQSQISHTLIVNGLFLDWGMAIGFNINPKGVTQIYGDGNTKHSTTLLSDIGKAVVGVLRHPEETKNRTVYVQSACVTQNGLLEIAKKVKPGLKPETKSIGLEELEKQAYEKLQTEKYPMDFISISIFHPQCGSNWSDKTDNQLFGIKELSPEELQAVVAKHV